MNINEAKSILLNNGYILNKHSIMERYYNILSNEHEPILLEKLNMTAIWKRHGKYGFAMISANRSDMSDEYNEKKTRELISDLKASGFRYMPIYGGYKGDDNVVDNYEPSFMVFPYNVKAGEQNPEELKEFVIDMCGKYKQNSILLVEPEGIPNYLDMNGNKINKSSTRNLSIDDALQTYFTSFKTPEENEKELNAKLMRMYKVYKKEQQRKGEEIESFEEFKLEHIGDVKNLGRRITMDMQFECFCNPAPCTLNERMRRDLSGEIMPFKYKNGNLAFVY